MNITLFWDVASCGVMKGVVSTSETSVNFYQTTRHYILEYSYL
jgi:hypothetical protein